MQIYLGNLADTKQSQEFLIKNNILRIELDNLHQGIIFDLSKSKVKASLYYPYGFISTTRLCPTANCDSKSKKILVVEQDCGFECKKYTFELSLRNFPEPMKLKGNTYFYYINKIPDNIKWKGIDRLVFQPEIPM